LRAYDDFAGSRADQSIALHWIKQRFSLAQDGHLLFSAGTQIALIALFSHLPEGTIACEDITYPGFKAACQQTQRPFLGLPMDADGLCPDALETACATQQITALYCTPTLHNPTGCTWPEQRRRVIADIVRRHDIAVIEDDAYGFVSHDATPPLAHFVPERTYYCAGLSKCFSSALRFTLVHCPTRQTQQSLARVLHAHLIMGSTLTKAMALQVMKSGCLSKTITEIQKEAALRRALAQDALAPYLDHPFEDGFHYWLKLPETWSMDDFILHLRSHHIRLAPPRAFTTSPTQSPARIRLSLGAPRTLKDCETLLKTVRTTLDDSGHSSTVI